MRGEQGGRQELAQSARRDSVGRGKMEVTWEGSVWGDSLEEASPQKMEEGKKKKKMEEAFECERGWDCEQRPWEIEKEVLGMLSSFFGLEVGAGLVHSGWGRVGKAGQGVVGWGVDSSTGLGALDFSL